MRPARIQPSAPAAESPGTAVDRIWLRGTVSLTGTIGVALIGVAAATYLMAVGHDGAWHGLVVAVQHAAADREEGLWGAAPAATSQQKGS